MEINCFCEINFPGICFAITGCKTIVPKGIYPPVDLGIGNAQYHSDIRNGIYTFPQEWFGLEGGGQCMNIYTKITNLVRDLTSCLRTFYLSGQGFIKFQNNFICPRPKQLPHPP